LIHWPRVLPSPNYVRPQLSEVLKIALIFFHILSNWVVRHCIYPSVFSNLLDGQLFASPPHALKSQSCYRRMSTPYSGILGCEEKSASTNHRPFTKMALHLFLLVIEFRVGRFKSSNKFPRALYRMSARIAQNYVFTRFYHLHSFMGFFMLMRSLTRTSHRPLRTPPQRSEFPLL
jgi:hypothetical protein